MSYGLVFSLALFLLVSPTQCLIVCRMARVNNIAFIALAALLLTHVILLGNRADHFAVAPLSTVIQFFAAALAARAALFLPSAVFKLMVIRLAVLFLLVGIIGQAFPTQALGFGKFPKAIFPFSEFSCPRD